MKILVGAFSVIVNLRSKLKSPPSCCRSHAVHRSASTGRKQSSTSSSSEVRRSAGAGVKISLASLK